MPHDRELASSADDPDELSRAEFAYRRILAGIRSGEFKPGRRMREAELASQLGVSRTPIREAIRRLSSEGLVTFAASRGMMIAQLDKQQVRELYSLRSTLEGAAARLAAQHASSGEIIAMRSLLERSFGENDPVRTARLSGEFHRTIYEAAHNRYLARALAQLAESLALLPGTTFEVAGRLESAREEHGAILRAIEERRPEDAEALARRHIDIAGQTRMKMMFEHGGPDRVATGLG